MMKTNITKMKKSLMTIGIFAMSVCMMAACGNKSANNAADGVAAVEANDDNSPAMQLLNSVPFTEEGLKSMIKTPEKEALTPEEFEALFLAYTKVNINEKTQNLENNFVGKVRSEVMRGRKRTESADVILDNLLKNPSPQVRGVAVQQFGGLYGMTGETASKLVKALENEQNAFVLKEGIKTLSNQLKYDDVKKFVLGQIDNPEKEVRKAIALSVGNFWSRDIDGVKDAAMKLLGDGDEDVRKTILGYVGQLADDSFVPELVKVLNDPNQGKLHGDAMRSLYTMWYDYPQHKNTSKAAYEATVKYLKTTPRTKDIPAWQTIGGLQNQNAKDYDAWKAKATYYNNSEFVKLMMDIAADPNANWLGRGPAVKVIAKIGTKADLEKVKSLVSANSDDKDQKNVLQAIEKELK